MVPNSAPLTLAQLKRIVIDKESTWETVPEFYGDDRAVLESDVAITLEWARDRDANTGGEEANGCYSGLTRDVFAARVLYCGQPVLQATLLMVKKTSEQRLVLCAGCQQAEAIVVYGRSGLWLGLGKWGALACRRIRGIHEEVRR